MLKSKSKNNIFISHSSENKEIVLQLSAYIERLGVKPERIFCSSIVSQGVKNGEKLGTSISNAINESKILIFLLSHDFINSSYCMQELGAGWHLSEQNKAKCFCLVLPDISLSEVSGFVNSKIFKFTFVDEEHRDELGLFAENLCNELGVRKPTHSQQTNSEKIFFSAISSMLNSLVAAKQNVRSEENASKQKLFDLERELSEKQKTIEKYKASLDEAKLINEDKLLQREMQTIERYFRILGLNRGINRAQFEMFSKSFWFDIINRYKEIESQLGIKANDDCMEKLIATVYALEGNQTFAYEHMKNYVELTKGGLYFTFLSDFFKCYHGTMKDVIDIVTEKLQTTKEGIVRDSYIEFIADLKKREEDIMEASHVQ